MARTAGTCPAARPGRERRLCQRRARRVLWLVYVRLPDPQGLWLRGRICYHGVLDSFRTPNWRQQSMPVRVTLTQCWRSVPPWTSVITPPGSWAQPTFSQCPADKALANDVFVTALRRSEWTALPHPPFVMDDTIGELLETQNTFLPPRQPLCGIACWLPGNMAWQGCRWPTRSNSAGVCCATK